MQGVGMLELVSLTRGPTWEVRAHKSEAAILCIPFLGHLLQWGLQVEVVNKDLAICGFRLLWSSSQNLVLYIFSRLPQSDLEHAHTHWISVIHHQ